MTTRSKVVALVALLLACVRLPLDGQAPATLAGVVMREGSGDPLPGASITLVEARLDTRSDEEGAFSFPPLPFGQYTIRASMAEHVSLVEPLSLLENETAYLHLSLAPLAGVLDEILAIVERPSGRSRNLIEVESGDARSVADVLENGVPGLDLRRNMGSASGGARVRVRGVNSLSLTNEPIFLVDGVRISARSGDLHSLEMIPASSIRRIRILRGPSAQFPDAANGVILIETAAGRGDAPGK